MREREKAISLPLGHSRIAITLDTCTHTRPSMREALPDKPETLLTGAKKRNVRPGVAPLTGYNPY